MIFDALEAESIPPMYLMITQGMRTLKFKNRGTFFLLANNKSVRSVIEITSRVAREHFPLRVFTKRQDAIEALNSYLERDNLRTQQRENSAR